MDINIISPINPLGYGVAGLNLLTALAKDNRVCLFPIGQVEIDPSVDKKILQDAYQNSSEFVYDAPSIKIWHQNDMAQSVGRGRRIGFPFFELNKFTKLETHHLNSLDTIFVTSDWYKQIIMNETSIRDVQVIPLGVNTKIFKPKEHEFSDKTIFFNCGKWEIRKGHDILHELFNDAFEKDDDVELWVMPHNPFITENEEKEWHDMYKNTKLGDKIRFINRVKTHEEVYNIMCNVDCGIFPSKAEGWNLELLEMLACGKQVITTNYSAHTEFCNSQNSFLVDIEKNEIAYDGKWFNGKVGEWACIDKNEKDQFIEHMRNVHNNKKFNQSGVDTAQKFTWQHSANKVVKVCSIS